MRIRTTIERRTRAEKNFKKMVKTLVKTSLLPVLFSQFFSVAQKNLVAANLTIRLISFN